MTETSSTRISASSRKVQEAADRLGLTIEVRQMAASTRTAEEAAAACECTVGQIVKSLVFQGRDSGRPYLLLVSGSNRVDETAVAATIGEALTRPNAAAVRDWTGFVIGGIPPFGHATALPTYMDEDLLAHEQVFAAAGTPNAIFGSEPRALAEAVRAVIIKVR